MSKKKCARCGYKFSPKEESETICDLCKVQIRDDSAASERTIHGAVELAEGEEIILPDGNIGYNKIAVLTNMRIVFLKGKGTFSKTFQKEDEISLEEIEYARCGFEVKSVVLHLKNGEKDIIPLALGDTDLFFGGIDRALTNQQATIDRWVNAINANIKHGPTRVRCPYCSQLYDATLVNCPRCGASR